MKESFVLEESMQNCEVKCEGIYTCEGNGIHERDGIDVWSHLGLGLS